MVRSFFQPRAPSLRLLVPHSPHSVATTPVYVPDGSDLGSVYLSQNLAVDIALAPNFGAVLTPWKRWRFTTAV